MYPGSRLIAVARHHTSILFRMQPQAPATRMASHVPTFVVVALGDGPRFLPPFAIPCRVLSCGVVRATTIIVQSPPTTTHLSAWGPSAGWSSGPSSWTTPPRVRRCWSRPASRLAPHLCSPTSPDVVFVDEWHTVPGSRYQHICHHTTRGWQMCNAKVCTYV